MNAAIADPARVLYDPLAGIPVAIERRRWVLPLLLLAFCTSLSGAVVAVRWDATPAIVQELSQSGELATTAERELGDQVRKAERVKLIGAVAKGVFLYPLLTLLLAVVLKLTAWLINARAAFSGCISAAALALLPIALFHLLLAVAAFRQSGLVEGQAATLLPSNLKVLLPEVPHRWSGLMASLDFFTFWSVGLLGLGVAHLTSLKRWQGMVIAAMLFAAYLGVFAIGLQGLGGH